MIVENNEAKKRFQIKEEDSIASLKYEGGKDTLTLIHTEVPPEREGKGIGKKAGQGRGNLKLL